MDRQNIEFTCAICIRRIKKAVVLPCAHWTCELCLSLFAQVCDKAQLQVFCPECHKDLKISPLYKTWMVRTRAFDGVLERVNEKCAKCLESFQVLCIDCKKLICESCEPDHVQGRFRFHSLVTIEEFRLRYCSHHYLKKEFWRRASHLNLCQACIVLNENQDFEREPRDFDKINEDYAEVASFMSINFDGCKLIDMIKSLNDPLKFLQCFYRIKEFGNIKTQALENPSKSLSLHLIERNGKKITVYNEKAERLVFTQKFHILRWSASTELESGDILITGGKNDKDKGSSQVFYLVNMEKNIYASGNMVQSHSSHPAVLAHHSKVFILGGKDEKNITNTQCEVFNTETLMCTPISSMNIARTCAASVYCNDCIYIMGGISNSFSNIIENNLAGFSNGFTNSIEKYEIFYDSWMILNTTLPVKLFQPGAVMVDNHQILVFGGEISSEFKNLKTFVFNTRTQNFGLCRNMNIMEYFLGFWYQSKVFEDKVACAHAQGIIKFDLKSTVWSKIKVI